MQAFQLQADLDPFEYIPRIGIAGSYGSPVLILFEEIPKNSF
jgi:hypothetical protein